MEVTGLCFAVVAIRGTASWNCWFVVSWRHIFSIAFVYLLLISVLEFKRRQGGRFSSTDSFIPTVLFFFFFLHLSALPIWRFFPVLCSALSFSCLSRLQMHLAVAWPVDRPTDRLASPRIWRYRRAPCFAPSAIRLPYTTGSFRDAEKKKQKQNKQDSRLYICFYSQQTGAWFVLFCLQADLFFTDHQPTQRNNFNKK